MNKVILIGRLCNDPELKENEKNKLAKFTVAVNRIKDGADYISCLAWNKTAELISAHLKKGSQIALEGRIQTGSYEAHDGTKRYTTDVIVENITFVGSKVESKKEEEKSESAWEDLGNSIKTDDIVLNDEDLPF